LQTLQHTIADPATQNEKKNTIIANIHKCFTGFKKSLIDNIIDNINRIKQQNFFSKNFAVRKAGKTSKTIKGGENGFGKNGSENGLVKKKNRRQRIKN